MYVRFIFLSLIVILCNHVSAQYEVKWGPVYAKDGGLFSSYFVGPVTEDAYMVVSKPKKECNLITYDYDHKLVKNKPSAHTFDGETLYPTSVIKTAAGQYALLGYFDKKGKMTYSFCAKYEDGKFGELKTYHEQPYEKPKAQVNFMFINFGKKANSDAGGFEVSENGKYILQAQPTAGSSSKSDMESITVTLMDSTFEKIWTRNLDFDGRNDQDMLIQQWFVDNSGNAFASATMYKDKKDREKGIPNYDFSLFQIGEEDLNEYSIELEGGDLPYDVGIFNGDNREVVLGGMYTVAGSSEQQSDGVFYSKIGLEGEGSVVSYTYKFTPEFLEDLLKAKAIKKDKGLSNFKFHDLIVSENGDLSFLAEETYTTTRTRKTSSGYETITIYHTDEIIVPRFAADGTLINIEKIDKDYSSEAIITTSYSLSAYGDKIYVLFNDKKSKSERAEDDVKGGKFARFTDLAVLGSDGKIEFWETLFSSREIETEFVPSYTQQVAETNRILIHGMRLKGYQFGVLDL